MQIPTNEDVEWAKKKYLATAQPANGKPVFFSMAGIPGSGKTTFIMNSNENNLLPEHSFDLNPDSIMTSLPQYELDYRLHGRVTAFNNWEAYARAIAEDYLFPLALQKMTNISVDMGFAREKIFTLANIAKTKGYIVDVVFVFCDIETAIRRASVRNRHIDRSTIITRAQFLRDNKDRIKAISSIIRCIDNSIDGARGINITWEELVEKIERFY